MLATACEHDPILLSDFTDTDTRRKTTQPVGKWVVISLLVHVFIAFVLSMGNPFVAPTQTQLFVQPAIKAQLIVPALPLPPRPKPVIENIPPQDKLLPKKQNDNVASPSPSNDNAAKQQENDEISTKTIVTETAAPIVPAPPEQGAPMNNEPSIETTANASEAKSSTNPNRTRDNLSQYFNSQRHSQIEQDSTAAAHAFRKLQTSPILESSYSLNEEQLYEERPEKIISCDSTVNKSLALISGIAGGTLKCSKRGDFEKFIKERQK